MENLGTHQLHMVYLLDALLIMVFNYNVLKVMLNKIIFGLSEGHYQYIYSRVIKVNNYKSF